MATKKIGKATPLPRVLVRGDRSGVQFGLLESRTGTEVVLQQARRVWYWAGAASISQLAQVGTSDPARCKFPIAVARATILDAIEVLEVTDAAWESLTGVKEWRQ